MVVRRPQQTQEGALKDPKLISAQLSRLVDTCFEEGQYESAIDVLNESRSPDTYPAPYHVRALLYIALYPPLSAPQVEINELSLSTSPRKERSRKHIIPTAQASQKATTLLLSYAMSLSPDYLFRGMPAYGKRYVDGEGWQINPMVEIRGTKNHFLVDECPRTEDNPILRLSTSLAEAKDLWAFLTEDFIKKLDSVDLDGDEETFVRKTSPRERSTPPKKTRRSNRLLPLTIKDDSEVEEATSDAGLEVTPQPHFAIASQAWTMLDWALLCFEKDAKLHDGSSPLLLSQLPIDSPRTDISTALQVAFAAFTAGGPLERRFDSGMRLLTQVIYLTIPPPPHSLSPAECVRQTCDTLARSTGHSSSNLPADFLQSFLSHLSPVQAPFKLALCCLYLALRSNNGNPAWFLGRPSEKPLILSRSANTPLKLKLARKTAVLPDEGDGEEIKSDTRTPPSDDEPLSIKLLRRFPIPGPTEVLSLLTLRSKTSLSANPGRKVPSEESVKTANDFDLRLRVDHATAKLHVVMALCWLMSSGDISYATDAKEWMEVLKSSEFRQLVGRGMAVDDDVFSGLSESGSPVEKTLAKRLQALKVSAAAIFLA